MGNCIRPPKHVSGGLPPIPPTDDSYAIGNVGDVSSPSFNRLGRSPSRPKPNGQKTVIALYSFEGRDEGELSFEKGDRLIIIDDKEPDWWLAKKLNNEKTGYIPMNFVVSNIIETEE